MASLISSLCSLVKSDLEEVGVELVDLELKKVSSSTLIRVYVDKAGGVTISEITEATKRIRDKLDQSNLVEGNYELEVSSPGSNRSLRKEGELERYPGRLIKLYLMDGGIRRGTVAQVTSESVRLKREAGDIEEIRRDSIKDMHLLFSCD
jgi:ribosome maturation factor RimP